MKKCKITVMRITRYEDLMQQYENPISHACDLQEGQVFIANGWQKPEGLCPSAWEALSPFVLALSHGAQNFFDGWMKDPFSAMVSCNDGFRPVSFLVEALDEPAEDAPTEAASWATQPKIAVCYYSRHHGNTLKVLQAMSQVEELELIDVTTRQAVLLDEYDCIGFASGIYGFDVHKSVAEFAKQYLPLNKPVFFVYTYGGAKGNGAKTLAEIAREKGCTVLGEFGCKGYDTFGPFKLTGGIAKGHPNAEDLENARNFYRTIQKKLQGGAQG